MKQLLLLIVSLFYLAGFTSPTLAQGVEASEQAERNAQVTALFLYNFVNFSRWPDEAFDSPVAPVKMCLYGDIPFMTYLDAVNGTKVGRRELAIFRTQHLSEIRNGCHLLFVSEDRRAELPNFWKDIRYYYVLSVGEQDNFTERGGIINIQRTTDQMSFDINVKNALEVGLFLEADLLDLAREVKQR